MRWRIHFYGVCIDPGILFPAGPFMRRDKGHLFLAETAKGFRNVFYSPYTVSLSIQERDESIYRGLC